jgi:hypothetical protein
VIGGTIQTGLEYDRIINSVGNIIKISLFLVLYRPNNLFISLINALNNYDKYTKVDYKQINVICVFFKVKFQ